MTRLLLGPVSIDRYVDATFGESLHLPGGGALNMAYHWATAGEPFTFLTRIGDDSPEVILRFLHHHGIVHLPNSIVAPGTTASIDIVMRADRQPFMHHFVEGVWAGFHLTAEEEGAVAAATHLHAVLVDPVVAEVHRLGAAGALRQLYVSGDFLDFRHYTLDRFAATMAHLALGFIGWPGAADDPLIDGVREVAQRLRRMVVITLGSRGVLVIDGSAGREQFASVHALAVEGTTVGCGDAFIAGFLAEHWAGHSLQAALDRGRAAGAAATRTPRPLPDDAYSLTTG
ncbi:MAG: PfkB family carbohydrate kinase [Actinomycetota bacterium]|nr:PfkB family carbohydrate kinase [Actinomycetota bacterium]